VATEFVPPDIEASNDNRSAQVIQIDSGRHVSAVAICAALCGLSAALAIWSAHTATRAQKFSELTNYYLMDPHSRTPDELAAWTKFRLEHEKEQ
jgi:hypothetical protein